MMVRRKTRKIVLLLTTIITFTIFVNIPVLVVHGRSFQKRSSASRENNKLLTSRINSMTSKTQQQALRSSVNMNKKILQQQDASVNEPISTMPSSPNDEHNAKFNHAETEGFQKVPSSA